jgi:quercetin dioxygenase-like cupin family protein
MAKYRSNLIAALCSTIVAALALVLGSSGSQQPFAEEASHSPFAGNKVTNLVTVDLTGVANRQVVANIYEVPAGAMVPRHSHHGDEFHLVLAGEWAAEVQDRPVHVMKAGDAQYVERDRWHGGKVISQTPMRLLGIMIVEKDKPLIVMAK